MKEQDKLLFYKDEKGEWRWKRSAANGEVIGASHEGFKNWKDCSKNFERQADAHQVEVDIEA